MYDDVTIVCGADAAYFDLAADLVRSIRDRPEGREVALSVFDLGFTGDQQAWLAGRGATLVVPDWDFDFASRARTPGHFRSLLARPFIPRYFPGYRVYLHLDADAWVQDWRALDIYIDAARRGKLAVTPQIDRAYNTAYKRQKRMGRTQNFRCFRWSYGWRVADRLGRNPILNAGVFALAADAPHWDLWARAIERGLNRRTVWPRRAWPHLPFKLVEQTALNYVVFGDRAPAALLPSWCNWMCALATPAIDAGSGLLVEPNEPFQPIGVVHFAGTDFQDRTYDLATTDGRRLRSMLRYSNMPITVDEAA